MKTVLSTLAYVALLSPLAVNAQQAFTGWDFGVTAGVIDGYSKFNNNNDTDADLSVNLDAHLGRSSGLIGISLGYAGCFTPCWNWGIELRANWTGLKSSVNVNVANLDLDDSEITSSLSANASASSKLNAQYAVIAQLGYLLSSSSQLYAFVGPQWGHFKTNASLSSVITDRAGEVDSINLSGSNSKYKTGVLAGLGLEQMIGDCYSIGLEYNYGHYGSSSHGKHGTVFVNGVPSDDVAIRHNHDAKLNTNAMLAKFNWYFG